MRPSSATRGPTERTAAGWLSSLVVHLGILLGLLAMVDAPSRPAGETLQFELHRDDERIAPVVLLAQSDSPASDSDVGDAFEFAPALTLTLPARTFGTPVGDPSQGAAPAQGQTTGRAGQRAAPGDFRFGHAHTELFGVPGEGYRFVYVFDRSGSMGGSGRSALEVAKAELLASLEPLERTHQFQIVFYNELPQTFAIAGKQGRLVFASEANKRSAAEFIRSVPASGSTRHEEALALALAMFPDVVYFLTDADEPALSETELARITRLNGDRSVIHAIEFGLGSRGKRENFLSRLARQNGGQHVYVDFSTWRPERHSADAERLPPERP